MSLELATGWYPTFEPSNGSACPDEPGSAETRRTYPSASGRGASISDMATLSETASEYLDATTLSADRATFYRRLLCEIESVLGPMPVNDIAALAALLDAKQAAGVCSPGTGRKNLAAIKAFYRWLYENGRVSADTYLSVGALRPPQGSSRSAQPERYSRAKLRELDTILDDHWPKLSDSEALKWLYGVQKGRTPYSRVRRHVIRCQLDAIIALARHLGLRRAEIFALGINDVHYYNLGVVVRAKSGDLDDARQVPFTNAARYAVEQWFACRWFLDADHDQPWLNLHAANTRSEPMSRHVFDKLLLTYIGEGWTLKRLRDTCANQWVRSGLQLEHVRQLLGYSRIEEVLPHARLVPGSLDGQIGKLDRIFTDLVEPVETPEEAEMAALHARSPGSSSAQNGAEDGVNPTVPTVTVKPAQSIYDPRGRARASRDPVQDGEPCFRRSQH